MSIKPNCTFCGEQPECKHAAINGDGCVDCCLDCRREEAANHSLEPFVGAATAASFLSLKPRRVVDLARGGKLPAHPLGDGPRRVWRFRLSELAEHLSKKVVASTDATRYRKTEAAS